jgi:hypothetical protein
VDEPTASEASGNQGTWLPVEECQHAITYFLERKTHQSVPLIPWERYDRHDEVESSEEEMALLGTVARYCQHSNTWLGASAQLGALSH